MKNRCKFVLKDGQLYQVVYCRYVKRNGKIYYPKYAKYFKFLVKVRRLKGDN